MPTGYTAKLMEDGQTFQEFIMGCARAFGALIEMRDEPSNATIPDKFEPSGYHSQRLIESTEKLAWLQSMTPSEQESFGQSEKNATIKRERAWLEKARSEDCRLENMAAQVKEWIPPTPDHQELKNFMLQQIDVSKNGLDYIKTSIANAEKKPAMAYYVAAVSRAAGDIKYNTEKGAEEIERANGRTEWIKQLRESI